ncbi:hypothetical protein ES703_72382 [subsurface metagenome]
MYKRRYATAQICINGHVITDSLESRPEKASRFCEQCGTETITNCPHCNKVIRGYYYHGGFGSTVYKLPAFCHVCGNPYPWTEAKLKAAHELAEELENLSASEKENLHQSIDDMVTDSPRTELAVTRFKKLLVKVGEPTARVLRELVVDIASSTAVKLIKGQ